MAQRDWMEKDYYSILGVSKDASKEEIRKAYRKLAQQYHPDANKGDTAAETRFKEISEAHAVLSNDEKRKEYDEIRTYAGDGGFGFGTGGGRRVRVNVGDLGDIFGDQGGVFEDFLGGFGFRGGPRTARGRDVETEVHLDFDDSIDGVTITTHSGVKAKIPAGV